MSHLRRSGEKTLIRHTLLKTCYLYEVLCNHQAACLPRLDRGIPMVRVGQKTTPVSSVSVSMVRVSAQRQCVSVAA